MAAPLLRPCEPWPIPVDCCTQYTEASPELQASVAKAATEALWSLSGRRFGICEHTIRPCRTKCRPSDLAPFPALYGGGYGWDYWHQWSMISICGCKDNCGCTNICELVLPGPVASIEQVIIDGEILGQALWRIDDFRKLVRRGGTTFRLDLTTDVDGPLGGPATKDTVTVTGDAALDPSPPEGTGIEMSTIGEDYNLNIGDLRHDLWIELDMPVAGGEVWLVGIVSGPVEVDAISGGAVSTVVQGTTAKITVGPVTVANEANVIRVRNLTTSMLADMVIRPVTLDGLERMFLRAVQWSDETTTGECWPECQDYNADLGETGAWGITYRRGLPVPELGIRAMGALSCEMVKLCLRDSSCMLPRNMAAMTRQGVTIRFQGKDATNAIIEFIPEVALFLRTWNPNGLMSDSGVFRADAPTRGRRTDT